MTMRWLLRVALSLLAIAALTVAGTQGWEQGHLAARSRRLVASGPSSAWLPPSTTAAAPTTTAAPWLVVLPTFVPSNGAFSRYFDGTLRLRNFQADGLGVGTAFVVADGNWALTNQHMVADALRLELETWDGEARGTAQVVALGGAGTDLALLRLDHPMVGALPVATGVVPLFSALVAGGYPDAARFTRSAGRLLRVSNVDGMNALVTDVPAAPGSSGSPLLNEAGEVVGIIFGGTDNATLAVPASEAVTLLASQQLAPTAD